MKEAIEAIRKAASLISDVTQALKKDFEVDSAINLLKEANFIADEEDLIKYKKELEKYPTESIPLIAKGWAQGSTLNKTANDWGVPLSLSTKSLSDSKDGRDEREETLHNKIMYL